MKKELNTVTAKALAGQIIRGIDGKSKARKDALIKTVAATADFKRLTKLKSQLKSLDNSVDDLEKRIEKRHGVDIWRDNNISVKDEVVRAKVTREDLADEIIVLHNTKGKTVEQITKELTAKYS